MTKKQSIAGKEEPLTLTLVQAPHFSSSSITIQTTGNEFTLMFTRFMPLQSPDGAVQNATNQVVAIVSVSPQAAKDISLLLADTVSKHEDEYGILETPYTRLREADGKR